ncbi:MAG: hypothetical protein L3J05_07645, partial [Robiginitomaculum sp.]|nr:hypothetical protein [Robiginitomaculum sp.]
TIFNTPFQTLDLSKIDLSIFDFNHSKYVESLPTVCHVGQLFRGQLATQSSETSRIVEKRVNGKVFWIMKKRPTTAKRCSWG